MSEQFENSIRKKLQDAEIPFDPDAWEKMKKRLDNPRRRPALFWWMLSGLLIFVAAGGSFWWWNQQSTQPATELRMPVTDSLPPTGTQIEPKPASAPNTTAPSAGSPLFVSTPGAPANDAHSGEANVDKRNVSSQDAAQGTGRRPGNTVQDNFPPSTGTQSSASPGTGRKISQQPSPRVTQSSIQQNATADTVRQSAVTAKQSSIQRNTTSDIAQQSTNITKQSSVQQNVTSDTARQSAVTAKQSSIQRNTTPDIAQQSTDITKQNTSSDTTKQSTFFPQQDSLPRKKTRKGFEGGITIGPDVNIASSMKMGRIGLGAGIILRYHFNNRWSIQSGAIYTKKIYGATPDDYHFDYPVTYTKIDADCNVVDVPLNLSYTFIERSRDRWSAVAGASSYFMLNEKYDYYYANGTKRSHEFKNQNQHYFSVLNLGVNWERQTAGRLRLALQPYVKVPLGGVGQGKVKLYSAGLALQVTMGKR